ncbi:hypothetical protein PIB30_088222 [Stylosanthes scabra]|uniref:Uncharacterized protein n=1 Tax=Stylosanthes scabra TaxID=79078 RepID=A0ABU6QUR3_9FABA|nr:hypothetical protein [Stylosanthes scabra]
MGTILLLTFYYLIRSDTLADGSPGVRKDFEYHLAFPTPLTRKTPKVHARGEPYTDEHLAMEDAAASMITKLLDKTAAATHHAPAWPRRGTCPIFTPQHDSSVSQAPNHAQITPQHGPGVVQASESCQNRTRTTPRRGLSPLTTPRRGQASPGLRHLDAPAWMRRELQSMTAPQPSPSVIPPSNQPKAQFCNMFDSVM